MSDDLLVTVKAALAMWERNGVMLTDDLDDTLIPKPSVAVLAWLRALVARCERAERELADKTACHTERVNELQDAGAKIEALIAERQRHAEAVEAAFRKGFDVGSDARGMSVNWHWEEAKARLT